MSGNNTVCPVMKNPVDVNMAVEAGLTAEYQGKIFYFCCAGCQPKFMKNPEQYLVGLPDKVSSNVKRGCSWL